MSKPFTFQEVILRLQDYWARQGCLIWQPYNTELGAGTMNPATFLRVLGPEPWNVGYVEPSVRPDDSRYGENPNRIQMHTQYQVILKPDPGNPQELYLGSLDAIGIDRSKHDIRFVEDNWESPALGAWGLGWEVWLDGQEITQFTYFQQAGGITLDPVAVEITYGLERIVMTLQGARHFKEIEYAPGITYGELLGQNEYEQSVYNLDLADTGRVAQLFDLYEQEAKMLLAAGLALPAYSYILKTSHTFNILDSRGAIGVTERARYFARMRDLAREVAQLWLEKRSEMAFPLGTSTAPERLALPPGPPWPTVGTSDFVLEIGSEELPADDVTLAVEELAQKVPGWLADLRLEYRQFHLDGTPRRLAVRVTGLSNAQPDEARVVKGPPARITFDAEGRPTRAAQGFARSQGIDVADLRLEQLDGGEYAVARVTLKGRPAGEVLAEALPELIASIQFPKSMRWNWTNIAYSRPLRWLVAVLRNQVVPFEYAGLVSGRTSRGLRSADSPEFEIASAADYPEIIAAQGIVAKIEARRAMIWECAQALAAEVGGTIPENPELLAEVANLVEAPTPLRGAFNPRYLELPRDILVTVMRKHQRYFPVEQDGRLLPYFITVANGDVDLETVREGNEEVIEARYADAAFFWHQDRKTTLGDIRPTLSGVTFQTRLGSMLDKSERIERLAPIIGAILGLDQDQQATAQRIAHLAKADLVTNMVVEFTSLQGIMGREYARQAGEPEAVATGIFEHYLPRFTGDRLPETLPGITVGLADRLDSLVGLFSVGLAPKATADPFALRRAALGLVQVLAERGLEFDLRRGVAAAAALQPVPVDEATQGAVLDFIRRRLEQWLLDQGFRPDLVQAVLAERAHNPARALATVRELSEVAHTERFQTVLTAYSRPARIIRGRTTTGTVQRALFEHQAERDLWRVVRQVEATITPDLSVTGFIERFEPLVEPINAFFNQVFVMVEDEQVRTNRLNLLKQIADLPEGIVDLTQVRGF
ncbi:MAG TPA: glycine--tRNA ligase subunit alpha/beta [Chloroflexi bacterium]|nr:glycine--tRNA ligase subunit alpha/beta [Chloroflexota bacterium]